MLDRPTTLYRTLEHTAREYGAREAFVCQADRLTWEEVLADTRRIAAALHASGVRKGDHVGIMLGNGATWLQTFFACATLAR